MLPDPKVWMDMRHFVIWGIAGCDTVFKRVGIGGGKGLGLPVLWTIRIAAFRQRITPRLRRAMRDIRRFETAFARGTFLRKQFEDSFR
jgi:hypothetical protein